jgi:hypothetical protein
MASRRVVESAQGNYASAMREAVGVAVEGYGQSKNGAERGRTPSAPAGPGVAVPYREPAVSGREAHVETRNESLTNETSGDRRRAMSRPDYAGAAESRLIAGIANGELTRLIEEATEKYRIGVGQRQAAGIPTGLKGLIDYLGGFALPRGPYSSSPFAPQHPGGPGRFSIPEIPGGDDGFSGNLGGYMPTSGGAGPTDAMGRPLERPGSGRGSSGGARTGRRGARPNATGFIPDPGGQVSEIHNHGHPPPRTTFAPPMKPTPPISHTGVAPGTTANPTPTPVTLTVGGKEAERQYAQDLVIYEVLLAEYNKKALAQLKADLKAAPPSKPDPVPPPPPPPRNPTAMPNPEGTGGPGPVGPWSRDALRSDSSRGREALPNPEGTGGPGPIGPWSRTGSSRGSSRGVYGPGGRYALPNPEGTDGWGPVGPRSRGFSVATVGTYGRDVKPNPEDEGRGPRGPAI